LFVLSAESDSTNQPSDVPSFRPRQLSGSDRGDLHAALASVVKSPAGNTLVLGGPGAGVGVGGNGSGSGPHFDGLGRLPAGMDMEAIRRQVSRFSLLLSSLVDSHAAEIGS
jgi:hypothetical protein